MQLKSLVVTTAAIMLGVAGSAMAADQSQSDNTLNSQGNQLKANDNGIPANAPGGKTSDRSGNANPDRGAGAGTTGAAGTGAGKTPDGPSDRRPDKKSKE